MTPYPPPAPASAAPEVPPVPRGPGVHPPFAAPPRDQDRRRMWWGIGIGAVILVLVCGGGIAALGFLASGSEDLVRSQALATVRSYLTAVRDERYSDAYDLLCDDATSKLSESGFESRRRDEGLEAYLVGTATISTQITVATTQRFRSGAERSVVYPLTQSSNGLKICGGV